MGPHEDIREPEPLWNLSFWMRVGLPRWEAYTGEPLCAWKVEPATRVMIADRGGPRVEYVDGPQ